jgi:hypothetical protein
MSLNQAAFAQQGGGPPEEDRGRPQEERGRPQEEDTAAAPEEDTAAAPEEDTAAAPEEEAAPVEDTAAPEERGRPTQPPQCAPGETFERGQCRSNPETVCPPGSTPAPEGDRCCFVTASAVDKTPQCPPGTEPIPGSDQCGVLTDKECPSGSTTNAGQCERTTRPGRGNA